MLSNICSTVDIFLYSCWVIISTQLLVKMITQQLYKEKCQQCWVNFTQHLQDCIVTQRWVKCWIKFYSTFSQCMMQLWEHWGQSRKAERPFLYAGTVKRHNVCKCHVAIDTGVKQFERTIFPTLFQWNCNCFQVYFWRNCAEIESEVWKSYLTILSQEPISWARV